MHKLQKNTAKISFAFTLAEVLITLGIIGVVAALTIPTLIQKNNERITITSLKKSYSALTQAIKLVQAEEGDIDSWGTVLIGGNNLVDVYKIVNKLKLAKDCGFNPGGCMAANYKVPNGNAERDFENLAAYYKFILPDGSSVALEGWFGSVNGRGEIWIDTNGPKIPNIVGQDLFIFAIDKNTRLLPYGTYSSSCKTDLYVNGFAASDWIFQFDNMDYLECPSKVSYATAHSCN